MKNFILDFTGFVNENFDNDSEFGDMSGEDTGVQEMPKEVESIVTSIINGNFERHKILGIEGGSVKIRASKQDFDYAPDVLTLRDMGFEAWSGKGFDVKLELDEADPSTGEITYSIEFTPKEARRAKAEVEDEPEIEDNYYKADDFDSVPETPEEDDAGIIGKDDTRLFRDEEGVPAGEDDDEDEDTVFEGRKKVQTGGFPKLKIKQAPKKDNPNLNIPKTKGNGLKDKDQPAFLKKDPKKNIEVNKEKKEPPIKK